VLRSKTAAFVVAAGLVALASPSSVIDSLSLLPGIDIASFPFLRWWGAAYVTAGVLVEWDLRTERSDGIAVEHVAGVAITCVAALLSTVLVDGGTDVTRDVVLSVGVVIPLVVGSVDTTKGRFAAVSLALVPICLGAIVIDRPFAAAAPALWTPAVFTLYSLVFGAPLYLLGRVWRLGGPQSEATRDAASPHRG
jgi:hypothetical protein